MQSAVVKYGMNLIFIVIISFLIVLSLHPDVLASVPALSNTDLQSFKTIFISILLEAFPFILLGVFISSLMQIFITEQMIARIVPRNPIVGVALACLLGVFFPVCECGLIPVVRRLILKGMPSYLAVTFMLTGPIVNPVVFAATYMAFRNQPEMIYARMGLAIFTAAVIGLLLYRFMKTSPLKADPALPYESGQDHDHIHAHEQAHTHGHEHHRGHHAHDHHLAHDHSHQGSKWTAVLDHACGEFFDMGKYLMFGAMVTAIMQTFVTRSSLVGIGYGNWSSHFFMMGYGYVLSLCSTSDAFVAASFAGTFSAGSLLTFMVFGPMLDFKSTLMLFAVFRKRFVLWLMLLIAVLVLIGSKIVEQLIFN